MNTMLKVILLAGIILTAAQSHAGPILVATYTVDVARIKDSIALSKCSRIVTLPPDSDIIEFYEDYTFVETVYFAGSPTYIYGTWGGIDGAAKSKFRFNYSGNAGEGTGSWGEYIDNMESLAGVACSGSVEALAPSLRFITGDIAVKTTQPGVGTGTAKSTFQTEFYGYDNFYDVYGRGSEKRSTSGTFVWH